MTHSPFAGKFIGCVMNKYFYDLHIHSCLSPCGDDDMTPENIAGMAALKGLGIVALTDHNSCKNCPAFFAACKKNGIIPVAGAEITTCEDVHTVVLFESLCGAMEFDKMLFGKRNLIKNRPDIFGRQIIYGENDEPFGEEEFLLLNATSLSIEQTAEFAKEFGGICYPAHIDREANGIISALGVFPEKPDFRCVEYHDKEARAPLERKFGRLKEKQIVVSSDAHYLWDINEAENFFTLEDEPYSGEIVRRNLFKLLKGEEK